MQRGRWLVVASGALAALGLVARWQWPSSAESLPCEAEQVRFQEQGGQRIATCQPGALPTQQERLALGLKLHLNQATEAELTLLPGVGPGLARKLVEARQTRGHFRSWQDVDEVAGMGAQKLKTLRALAQLP